MFVGTPWFRGMSIVARGSERRVFMAVSQHGPANVAPLIKHLVH